MDHNFLRPNIKMLQYQVNKNAKPSNRRELKYLVELDSFIKLEELAEKFVELENFVELEKIIDL